VIVDIASVGVGSYDKRCIILTGLENGKNKARQAILAQSPAVVYDDNTLHEFSLPLPPGMIISPENLKIVEKAAFEMYKLFINPSAFCKLQTDINQSRLFRVDAGLLDLMSLRESRQVTTIFIRIGSLSNWESDQTMLNAQSGFTIVKAALKKHEGSLRQMHVDEKGATILIFFGLPPIAHENDASYGLKAGLEISKQFEDLFDDFSIGITTGMVSLGGVGNESRIEYAVVCFITFLYKMGDSINMAARLMCNEKANQTILCDEKTRSMTETEFSFEELGQIKVKGKNEPISIHRPLELKVDHSKNQITHDEISLIGRDAERKIISESLEAHASSTGPRILVLEGDGGMGLSTLARWTHFEVEKCGYRIGFVSSLIT
jgi:hypothetical protein